ncbi:MAG: RNA methyltransferase [Clostridia bacterium]|nr:RNA methyltransferase [Clostridia bacterium]
MSKERITSRANPYIKEIAQLSERKHRIASGRFFFEGRKLFHEALENGVELEAVLMTDSFFNKYKENNYPFRHISVTDEVYSKISAEKSPEGVFCVAKTLDKLHKLNIIYGSDSEESILLLDGLRDPGNVGTILRTAAAFGCDNVILSSDCAEIYNPKTVRAGMGAVFRQKTVTVSDMPGTVRTLREHGRKVLCATLDENSVSLQDMKISHQLSFVIGNEGNGIRQEVIDAADGSVIIPMLPGAESLNASAAATVLLWEQFKSTDKAH